MEFLSDKLLNMADPLSKNRLQEYFQKRQLSLPSYYTVRIGGGDHAPKWKSVVTIADGSQFISDICSTKGGSEISAASKGLMAVDIKNEGSALKPILVLGQNTALIVDVENLPKFIDELYSLIDSSENLTVYGFIGKHHCLIEKEFKLGTIKVVSPSTRSDGTDTTIQVYTGLLLAQEKYEKYLIATRDHFGAALVETIMTPNLGWVAKSAKLVTQPKQIFNEP